MSTPMTDRFLREDRLQANARMFIMVGFSRTGKSTWVNMAVKQMAQQGYAFAIVSGDDVRRALGVRFLPALEPQVHATTDLMAKALMMRHQNIIIDETNLTEKARQHWKDLAKQYDYAWSVVEIQCLPEDIHKAECEKHQYPWSVIEAQKARYEPVLRRDNSQYTLIEKD